MPRLRLSLFAKIMTWFFLNLVLLGAIFLLLFRLNVRIDQGSWFFSGATNRLETVQRVIEGAVDQKTREERDEILARYSGAYNVDFFLFDFRGNQLGGAPVQLPEQVYADIVRIESFGPGPRQPSAANSREPGELPPAVPPSTVSITTSDPTTYWVILRIMTYDIGEADGIRTRLVVRSDSFFGNGLFFDPRPWFAGAMVIIFVSILFWLPLVRSINRSVRQMTGAAERIADEDFSIRVDEARSDELGSLGSSINHLAARLSGFVTGQKRFLGDISHELNSPLARMQFALSILEERARPEDLGHINDVREELETMSRLVGELLTYSKAGLKGGFAETEAVDLAETVASVVSRENAVEKRQINVAIGPGLEVEGRRELITRALSNVVRNSIMYSDAGTAIEIVAEQNGNGISLTVTDVGPGVPERDLDRIFDPLFRVSSDRSRTTGGSGLGLAIVRTCIEACGGKVAAHNREPRGLEVVMTLPLASNSR